jgi:murein DD-endopeptidase MepM/ murein hydrolase activator NlpD
MKPRGKQSILALWNICILGMFLVGCSSAEYGPRGDRKPVPTIAEAIDLRKGAAKSGGKHGIEVKRGDSLYTIARRHGVALRGLIRANKLSPPYVIYPGQRLKFPVSRIHVVSKGQTVYQVARIHNVDMGSLVRINKIEPPYRVARGQRLRLPDTRKTKSDTKPRPAIAKSGTASGRPKPKWVVARAPRRENPPAPPKQPRWQKSSPDPIKRPPARASRKFLWPLQGKVIVSFGARAGGLHNDGINIAARKGASIRAAENGVVAYTGNQLQGFGNLVLLKHAGGWMSAYAHSSVILVKRGDVVRRGQTIARVGRTGNVSKPQLHFELRRGEHAVNPKKYLVRVAQLSNDGRQFASAAPERR